MGIKSDINPEMLERYFGPRWQEMVPLPEYVAALMLGDMEREDEGDG